MQKNKIIYSMLIFSVIILLIAACQQQAETAEEEDEGFIDTGILIIESTPSGADVYVNNKIEGQTPLTLYNMPVGSYNVKVRKESYNDFEKNAVVKVGVSEEIDVQLASIQDGKPQQEREEQPKKEKQPETKSESVSLNSFSMYYDFEGKLVSSTRSGQSDLFSRKYDNYIDFVAMAPAKIEITEKHLNEVSRLDCINTDRSIAQLKLGQTLCVITAEGNYFAASLKTMEELEYVQLS